MFRKPLVCFVLILGAGWILPAFAQGSNYWLVTQVTGQWDYRVGTEKPRRITADYEPLFPEGEVRCLEPDPRTCELRYLESARTTRTVPLPVKIVQSGQWVSLKRIKPPPPPPVLPAPPSDLANKFTRVTRAGGSRAASGCGGAFPLLSPICGETVGVDNLTIRWRPQASGNVALVIERIDGAPELFRAIAPAAAGEFPGESLHDFLRTKIQSQADPIDITVRVSADQANDAVRLVHVAPSARADDHAARLRSLQPARGVAAAVTRMSLALSEGMRSAAAEHALEVKRLAAGSRQLLEYAVVGLCESGYEEEKIELRKHIPPERYAELCVEEPAVAPSPSVNRTGEVAADPVAAPAAVRTRLGVALVIGNSEYWSMPLNSVKADVKEMSRVLASAGFEVVTKENLRNPRQFIDALNDVLKSRNANPEDVLLVYYSGHGLQLDGKAHLLGTDVSSAARVAEDLRDKAQSAEGLFAEMVRSVPTKRVLIVEACRDNVLSPAQGSRQVERGGFSYSPDVPNTFVMFANKPGLPTPVRSDYGLMGPFTEALLDALQRSSGEVNEVFELAAARTAELSPGQQPVLYRSTNFDRVTLKRESATIQNTRAQDLLNSAEPLYAAHAWEEFQEVVSRGRVLASDPPLQQRLGKEAEFARLAIEAERAEENRDWAAAGTAWQKARELFAMRQWVGMKAAVSWLLADDLRRAVSALAVLGAQSDNDISMKARSMLAALTSEFPSYAADAQKAASETPKIVSGPEFERIGGRE